MREGGMGDCEVFSVLEWLLLLRGVLSGLKFAQHPWALCGAIGVRSCIHWTMMR